MTGAPPNRFPPGPGLDGDAGSDPHSAPFTAKIHPPGERTWPAGLLLRPREPRPASAPSRARAPLGPGRHRRRPLPPATVGDSTVSRLPLAPQPEGATLSGRGLVRLWCLPAAGVFRGTEPPRSSTRRSEPSRTQSRPASASSSESHWNPVIGDSAQFIPRRLVFLFFVPATGGPGSGRIVSCVSNAGLYRMSSGPEPGPESMGITLAPGGPGFVPQARSGWGL